MVRVREPDHSSTIAGWREWASLPAIGVPWIKVKVDTGARTSALHAFDVEEFERDGEAWVRFGVQPWQNSDEDAVVVESRVHDRRHVRSSSGHVDERIVVLMDVVLLGRELTVEVTLSNRDEMGFRMLVGREALRGVFLVDPGESFLGGRAPKRARRRNRGRG
ncbi:hypothetical protein GE115_07765 [Agromyces sp. CFH 90414]|uniref:Retropepsin-like aspartic endopeptidase domain-containing protein n=1 Tax=Agromyces agglutinans TaxID=2662258 RepID=A0A6I2FCV3_9MICO|nr:RimK/LysX family protein [Agromyces agglutinans]MRG59763.1 hypothetical protein [Agromyces agglutinans]